MADYSIKDLTAISGTSERAVRQILSTNAELKELTENHIKKIQNRVFYDDAIYNWFVEHYKYQRLVRNAVAHGVFISKKEENPQTNPHEEEINRLKTELDEMKGKYEALQADFKRVEEERVELLRQNGNLLLLLSQEKAEKQALLPAPRKSFSEKIKGLFHRKEEE